MFSLGQIVYSKCGHDKNDSFVIVSIEGEFVYLADGHRRKISKPKKKKHKHVQPTNDIALEIKEKIENKSVVLDAEIKKALKEVINIVKR